MKNKVNAKDIRKAVKILKKYEIKPDKDGLVEIENPRIHFDLLDASKKMSIYIDNDIRDCIKEEINKHGSIVKRYGDWAKFINKEVGIAHYPLNTKYLFYQSLFYRGKHIRNYVIKYA